MLNIFRKFGAHNRTQAALELVRRGGRGDCR